MESPLIQPPEPSSLGMPARSSDAADGHEGLEWPVKPHFSLALDDFDLDADARNPRPYCPKRKAHSSGPREFANRTALWVRYHCALACLYIFMLAFAGATAFKLASLRHGDLLSNYLRHADVDVGHDMFVQYVDPEPPRNLTRVAIFADSAINEATKRVLRLVADEKADMVLHPGDIDYTGQVDRWHTQMASVLGEDFPYFFSAGNYEVKIPKSRRGVPGATEGELWSAYVAKREEILKALGVDCPFATPSRSQLACHYKGISFVLSNLSNHKDRLETNRKFVRDALAALRSHYPASRWTFCMWHAPYHLMQVGFRDPPPIMASSELEAAYDDCRAAGAIVLSGHEHYYLRTHTVTSFRQPYAFEQPITADEEGLPVLYASPGRTVSIVSGLGGHSVSVPSKENFFARPHLAAVHPLSMLTDTDPGGKIFYSQVSGRPSTTSEVIEADLQSGLGQGYPFGALFCELPVVPKEVDSPAYCYFKTIDGEIVDQFLISDEKSD